MHTTHWALQPWDDPARSQPHSYCEPRWTHRRPRNQTPLLRHAPAYAPGTGQGGSRTLFRTWPVYWAAHVPPSPQMPPRGLWIPFTPPRVRATHAGQSGQCPYKNTPARHVRITSFIEMEKVKQIEKIEEFVSNERIRK